MTDPKFVLVPGFSQTAGAWKQVVDALGGHTDTRALDIPHYQGFRPTAQALFDGRSGAWAGYSLGGRLALQIALDHPTAVEALVLISTNPGIADPRGRAIRRAEDERLADQVEAEGVEAFLTRWLSQPMFADLDPTVARRYRLDSASAIAHQLRTLGQGTQEPLWDRLPELTMPVTLVTGDRDVKYCDIARQAAAAIGSNARLHVVAEAGHNLLQEQPKAVAGFLAGFR